MIYYVYYFYKYYYYIYYLFLYYQGFRIGYDTYNVLIYVLSYIYTKDLRTSEDKMVYIEIDNMDLKDINEDWIKIDIYK